MPQNNLIVRFILVRQCIVHQSSAEGEKNMNMGDLGVGLSLGIAVSVQAVLSWFHSQS